MKRVVFMFPGQGSQEIGMGKDFLELESETKDVIENVNQGLGFDLHKLMEEGPIEELTKTKYAQPALVFTSSLIDRKLREAGVEPIATVGHSLGEYSALVSTGALELEAAVNLVHQRGLIMETADPEGIGGMAAVLGLTESEIDEVLSENNLPVEIANLNCPGQIVLSGEQAAIETLTQPLKDKGAKRVVMLAVSGPFHSSLMKPKAEALKKILDGVSFNTPSAPVYLNVTAKENTNPSEIKGHLVEQLYSKVRFEESVRAMITLGVDAFVEVGPKKVLTGLVKKIDRNQMLFSIQDQQSLDAFVDWFKEE